MLPDLQSSSSILCGLLWISSICRFSVSDSITLNGRKMRVLLKTLTWSYALSTVLCGNGTHPRGFISGHCSACQGLGLRVRLAFGGLGSWGSGDRQIKVIPRLLDTLLDQCDLDVKRNSVLGSVFNLKSDMNLEIKCWQILKRAMGKQIIGSHETKKEKEQRHNQQPSNPTPAPKNEQRWNKNIGPQISHQHSQKNEKEHTRKI
ncbi:uncharacterized protein [Mobula birostris]|uniref:uncharacterized protein n=1 Tax=Mobula birostris TaxID=1983395 RepID=UPI003B285D0E